VVLRKSESAQNDDEGLNPEGEDDNEKKGRRPKSTAFDFGEFHPLFATHTQRIRSKFLIPLLAGTPPPTLKQLDSSSRGYGESTAAGKKEMDRDALYLLTLLSPMESSEICRRTSPGRVDTKTRDRLGRLRDSDDRTPRKECLVHSQMQIKLRGQFGEEFESS
jgi:hypothetical protein